ncbi:hypothetical protein UFOVP54_31 [uncultured Caudovirales phage]|uniref:DUF7936 domain-containing protein n=1 Tax=uncultured Caudovirales phage TaxID=2100421 RepID=A0A6J5KSB9_9CAUD|nr:hypothetical protein UFOVP54_31 [uncultured Caudovirales phage]
MLEIKQIKYLENYNNLGNVIIQIDWEYSLEGFQTVSGTVTLPDPEEKSFIPVKEITQEVVLKWVQQNVNPESMELQKVESKPEIQTFIVGDINSKSIFENYSKHTPTPVEEIADIIPVIEIDRPVVDVVVEPTTEIITEEII